MNYTTITIDQNKIGLKFGMASFRYLSDKFVNNVSFNGNELNEIGIAHILYSGYYNNCLVKNVDVGLTFEYFVDYIEANINNEQFISELTSVIKVWSDSDIIKQTQEVKEPKKKTSRGKK